MHITTTYEVTEQDWLRMHDHVLGDRRVVGWILCGAGLVLGPLGIWLRHEVFLGVWGTLFGLGVLGQLTFGRRRAVRQMAAAAQGPAEITVTETSVAVRRPGDSFELAWSSVQVVETADFFLLYQGPKVFKALLKRGFTPDQQQELRAFIATLQKSPAPREGTAPTTGA